MIDRFEGFDVIHVATPQSTVFGRSGGRGSPVLLLHGMPETHLMWHRVAPRLATRFRVIATDLRGFGRSGMPASAADHGPYSMRSIARDQVEAMRALGHDQFAVVGHDRGARCAYRMALDHPDTVTRLAVLDILPTGDAFGRADAEFCLGFWIWSFLAAPYPVPERYIAAQPAVLVDHMLGSLATEPGAFPDELRAAYIEQFTDPDRVHAICEEYRAAATLDRQHDDADRGSRRIGCPVLVHWAADGAVGQWYQPLDIWREWATDVAGGPMSCGHFIPEEAPEQLCESLAGFLGALAAGPPG